MDLVVVSVEEDGLVDISDDSDVVNQLISPNKLSLLSLLALLDGILDIQDIQWCIFLPINMLFVNDMISEPRNEDFNV